MRIPLTSPWPSGLPCSIFPYSPVIVPAGKRKVDWVPNIARFKSYSSLQIPKKILKIYKSVLFAVLFQITRKILRLVHLVNIKQNGNIWGVIRFWRWYWWVSSSIVIIRLRLFFDFTFFVNLASLSQKIRNNPCCATAGQWILAFYSKLNQVEPRCKGLFCVFATHLTAPDVFFLVVSVVVVVCLPAVAMIDRHQLFFHFN